MKTILNKSLIGLLVLLTRSGNSQGFMNLNFEDGNLTGYPPGSAVPASNAFPGWTVNAPYIFYDNFSLSGEAISIIDTNSSYLGYTIEGRYYAFFVAGNSPSSSQTITIGQSGAIPSWAQSITFWGTLGGMQVTFDGNPLYFSAIGNGPNYTIYRADISPYASQTGELLFTLPPYVNSANLDNIQFSNIPIPEPSTLSLIGLGLLSLGWHWRRRGQN